METLDEMMTELGNELEDLESLEQGTSGQVYQMGHGLEQALRGLRLLLQHIGPIERTPSSAYGATPLKRP